MAPFGPNLAHFYPKFSKTVVFCIFFENRALEFPNILHEAQSLESKKNDSFAFFVKNSKMTHFSPNWAKFYPNLGILVVKNFFFPSFLQKSNFHHFYPLYDLTTFRKYLKCLKLRFSTFFEDCTLEVPNFLHEVQSLESKKK